MRQSSSESRRRFARELPIAVASGLAASAASGVVDRALDPLVDTEQKLREKPVRSGSPHGITYGVFWGLICAMMRGSFRNASRAAGLPFAVPFYFACDGIIAPLLSLTPTRMPWQLNVKELANHLAWTSTTELERTARHGGLAYEDPRCATQRTP
jgi:putative membrane protein